jgi:CHAT domain-containing protein
MHVLLLPQGPLGFFPLAIARNPTSGETLIKRYELSLSPGLTALSHTRVRAKSIPDSIAAISDPRNNLPFANFETELANSWFASNPSSVLSGSNCSLANTLERLRGRSIWHFACHGNFDLTLPLNSGLDLAGKERLTLRELFETRSLGQPRLVILSACETGLYDLTELPHEFIGLPTGFLQAGAAGVIATLWPVWDISTALLLGRFYDEYLGRRLTPSAALRTAQLWLKDASREELRNTITEWHQNGRVSHENASAILRELDMVWSACDGPPFAAPTFWSGFVHYGH